MEKEHAYRRIERDLKGGAIGNVLLLFGKEQYLVKWAAGAAVKKYVKDECKAFDFCEMDAEKATIDAVIENCETLSMFSERRIVYLPDFPLLSGARMKNFPEGDGEALAEYVRKVPDSCLLIITAEKADKRKKLYKGIASCGGVYEFEPLDRPDLKAFIEKRFKLLGKRVKPPVVGELIDSSGYFLKETDCTLYHIENEVRKIAAHADGDEVMLSDVLEAVSGDVETYVFALTDAVGAGDREEAFRLLHNLIGSGGSTFHILALLASQFEAMLEVKEMKGEGKRLTEIQKTLGLHEYRVKKASSAAEQYTMGRLRESLKKVYQVEKNIKDGLMDEVLALEMMIAGVAG